MDGIAKEEITLLFRLYDEYNIAYRGLSRIGTQVRLFGQLGRRFDGLSQFSRPNHPRARQGLENERDTHPNMLLIRISAFSIVFFGFVVSAASFDCCSRLCLINNRVCFSVVRFFLGLLFSVMCLYRFSFAASTVS